MKGLQSFNVLRKQVVSFFNSHDAFKIRLLVQDNQTKQYFCQQNYNSVEYLELSDLERVFKPNLAIKE